jgi:hypothetical protein
MKKIDKVLKQLSDLYDFNRKIRSFELRKKEKANQAIQRTALARRR